MFVEFDYSKGGQILINTDQIVCLLPSGNGTAIWTTCEGGQVEILVMPPYTDVLSILEHANLVLKSPFDGAI